MHKTSGERKLACLNSINIIIRYFVVTVVCSHFWYIWYFTYFSFKQFDNFLVLNRLFTLCQCYYSNLKTKLFYNLICVIFFVFNWESFLFLFYFIFLFSTGSHFFFLVKSLVKLVCLLLYY